MKRIFGGKKKKQQQESDDELVAPTRPNLGRTWGPTGSSSNLHQSPSGSGGSGASKRNLTPQANQKKSKHKSQPSGSISNSNNSNKKGSIDDKQSSIPKGSKPPPPSNPPPADVIAAQKARKQKNLSSDMGAGGGSSSVISSNSHNKNNSSFGNSSSMGGSSGRIAIERKTSDDEKYSGDQVSPLNRGAPIGGSNPFYGHGQQPQQQQQQQQYPATTNGYQPYNNPNVNNNRNLKLSNKNSEGRYHTGGGNNYKNNNSNNNYNNNNNNNNNNSNRNYGNNYGGNNNNNVPRQTSDPPNRRPNKRDSELRAQYGGMTSPGGEFIATYRRDDPKVNSDAGQMRSAQNGGNSGNSGNGGNMYPNLNNNSQNAPHPSADQPFNPGVSAPLIDDEYEFTRVNHNGNQAAKNKNGQEIQPYDTAGGYPDLEKRGPGKRKKENEISLESDHSTSDSESGSSDSEDESTSVSRNDDKTIDDGKVVSVPKSGLLDLDNMEVVEEKKETKKERKARLKREKKERKEKEKQEKLKKKQMQKLKNSNALSEVSQGSKNSKNEASKNNSKNEQPMDIIIPPAEIDDGSGGNNNLNVNANIAASPASKSKSENEQQQPPPPSAVDEPAPPPPTESENKGLSEELSLEAWLESIGFRKKKLTRMIDALDALGIEDLDDLIMFLTDLYKSYGHQQKSWMDNMQAQLSEKGVKLAQWIRFEKEAQKLIESQNKKKAQQASAAIQGNSGASNDATTPSVATDPQGVSPAQPAQAQYEIDGTGRVVVMIQEEESKFLHKLQIAIMNMKDAIDRLTRVTLGVEENQQMAVDSVTKEFDNVKQALDVRRDKIVNSINAVAQDKFKVLNDQSSTFRAVLADYEESMATFNSLISSNERGAHSKDQLKKRIRKIEDLVSNTLSQHRSVVLTPFCTPLIGFHCEIAPIVKEIVKTGTVTWGNPPDKPSITLIQPTDWCIQLQWLDRSGNEQNSGSQVLRDPVIMYEIQCVVCENENDLTWNFDRFRRTQGSDDEEKDESNSKDNKSKKKSKKKDKDKQAKIKAAALQGVVCKYIPNKSIVLAGFVQHSIPYCIRVRAENRNGWGDYSFIKYVKTSKKKKRKEKQVAKIKIANHYGHQQDSGPENLLVRSESRVYNSLSNADFLIAEKHLAERLNKHPSDRSPTIVNDWIVFDLCTLVELAIFKIKFNVATRWSNVPKIIYIEVADYDANMDLIYGYRPLGDDFYANMQNEMNKDADTKDIESDSQESQLTEKDISEIRDENENKGPIDPNDPDNGDDNNNNNNNGDEDDAIKAELAKVEKEAKEELRKEKEKKRLERAQRRRRAKWEKEQIAKKRQAIMVDKEQREVRFERIWRRIAILETKKKQDWQEFYLDDIDKTKRRAKYVRVQFVENFGCSIETYCRFVVEQMSFSGIIFDFDK